MPAAACGVAPGGQPLAGAMFTVGMRVCCGGGNVGCEPLPADTGRVATSPQALSASTTMPINEATKGGNVSLIDIERFIIMINASA